MQIERFKQKLLDKSIEITIEDEVYEIIESTGFDPQFGARPIKRAIQSILENSFARAYIAGEIKDADNVNIHYENDEIKFIINK